jgi:mitogen-activated protein kinase 15
LKTVTASKVEIMDHLDSKIEERFDLDRQLGRGAYGVVWRIIEKKTRKDFAVKKCFDSFRNVTDAQRTYREISYLQQLRGHDNIVNLISVFNSEDGKDTYLVFDFMPTDLYTVIRSRLKLLEDIHVRCE